MTTRKTAKTAADIRADIDDLQSQLNEMRKAERRAKRAEAKAAAEARAKADRALADTLLATLREAAPGVDDALLLPALRYIIGLTLHDQPLVPRAVQMVTPADDQTGDQTTD